MFRQTRASSTTNSSNMRMKLLTGTPMKVVSAGSSSSRSSSIARHTNSSSYTNIKTEKKQVRFEEDGKLEKIYTYYDESRIDGRDEEDPNLQQQPATEGRIGGEGDQQRRNTSELTFLSSLHGRARRELWRTVTWKTYHFLI